MWPNHGVLTTVYGSGINDWISGSMFECCSGCPLDLGGKVFEVDLIVFNLLGFDIILRMNWLFRHYTSINSRSWVVSFHQIGCSHRFGLLFKRSVAVSVLKNQNRSVLN